MKIAVIGAGGWLGATIAREALSRDIEVTAIGRTEASLEQVEGATPVALDATNLSELSEAIAGHDAVVGSVVERSGDDRSAIPAVARAVVEAVAGSDAGRALWVGGGGSLHGPDGTPLVEGENFPEEYRAEAQAGLEALRIFQGAPENVDWVFVSPPVVDLHDGPKGEAEVTVLEGDTPVMKGDEFAGSSSGDLAAVIVDEIERPRYSRQRITLGYAGA